MTIQLYELVGADDRRFSPYCWRIRMALAHKGLDYATVPCRFTDKDKIVFSGQDRVPVLVDGEQVIADSWRIACYLEDTYADRPSLFGDSTGRALTHYVNAWDDTELKPAILRVIIKEIHDHADPEDRDYFRRSREQRLGATLEALHESRDEHIGAVSARFKPLRSMLSEHPYLCGESPGYADYIVLGTCQWVRRASDFELIEPGDPIYRWRERMLDLFDGLARHGGGPA